MFNSFVFLIVLALDQYSKYWAEHKLQGTEPIPVLNNLFELHYSQNTGMAFSLFSDKPQFLFALVIVIMVSLVFYTFKEKRLDLSIAFILAGGLGNLLDRIIYGYVVDFINPLFIDFAIFNIADISLNVGVIVLILNWIATSSSTPRNDI